MLKLLAILATLASTTSCCGYNSDASIVIQEARPGEKVTISLPDGRKVEVEPSGGTWTNIDPDTGEIVTMPIDEVIYNGEKRSQAKAAIRGSGAYTIHPSSTAQDSADALEENPGIGYLQSQKAALMACQWPDEYPGSDEEGAAYREGQAAAEDADCHEDY